VPRRSPGFNSPKAPNNLANACYLESIEAINETRNKAAHGGDTAKVLYQGRNPFRDPDAFAQMYFDVWAIKQSISKFFERAITYPNSYSGIMRSMETSSAALVMLIVVASNLSNIGLHLSDFIKNKLGAMPTPVPDPIRPASRLLTAAEFHRLAVAKLLAPQRMTACGPGDRRAPASCLRRFPFAAARRL
jgi:hypothetical protein